MTRRRLTDQDQADAGVLELAHERDATAPRGRGSALTRSGAARLTRRALAHRSPRRTSLPSWSGSTMSASLAMSTFSDTTAMEFRAVDAAAAAGERPARGDGRGDGPALRAIDVPTRRRRRPTTSRRPAARSSSATRTARRSAAAASSASTTTPARSSACTSSPTRAAAASRRAAGRARGRGARRSATDRAPRHRARKQPHAERMYRDGRLPRDRQLQRQPVRVVLRREGARRPRGHVVVSGRCRPTWPT